MKIYKLNQKCNTKHLYRVPLSFLRWTLLLIIVVFFTTSCTTKGKKPDFQEITVIERPERMFWEIKQGNSTIFVLGTMHLADNNFYPIEETILNAFDSADYLVSEIGGKEEIKDLSSKMQIKILESLNLDQSKNIGNILTEEELDIFYNQMGETIVKPLLLFEPWVLYLVSTEFLYQKSGLDPTLGIDNYFIARADTKKIDALESIEEQLDLFSDGTFNEQMAMLYENIYALKNYNQSLAQIIELKRSYLLNDKKTFNKIVSERTKIDRGMNDKEYHKFMDKMLLNRNIKWANKFNDYLKRGGTTFVFAGAGHFTGENSVQNILLRRQNNF